MLKMRVKLALIGGYKLSNVERIYQALIVKSKPIGAKSHQIITEAGRNEDTKDIVTLRETTIQFVSFSAFRQCVFT
jgi:hypothetical protein